MPLCKDQQGSKLCYTNVYFTDTQTGSANERMHCRERTVRGEGHNELDGKL